MRLLAALALLAGAGHSLIMPRAPLLPSEDPFYTQPVNISQYAPGQVIATRNVPPNLGGFTGFTREQIKEYIQVLYRTTDTNQQPVAAVTSILVPYNAASDKFLAYQIAYDSSNNNCSPSYALQTGANSTAITDVAMIGASLNKGWVVVTSDYEGLLAQFVAGPQAGYATLDSVRVARSLSKRLNLTSDARYAMWGYSGGSLASEWAAELQKDYAPELNFAGTALGGLIPNVTNVLLTINGGLFAGLAFSGISGIGKAIPEAAQLLREQLLPAKATEFYGIAAGCLPQAILGGALKDLFTYFRDGPSVVYLPLFKQIITKLGIMGTHGVPQMPVFAYKAVADEVSPGPDTDKLVKLLCSKGATIEYHRDLIGGHLTEAITGSVSALAWVEDRLNGVPLANQGTCVTQDVVLSSIGPGVPDALLGELVSLLQSLLGSLVPLGPLVPSTGQPIAG